MELSQIAFHCLLHTLKLAFFEQLSQAVFEGSFNLFI